MDVAHLGRNESSIWCCERANATDGRMEIPSGGVFKEEDRAIESSIGDFHGGAQLTEHLGRSAMILYSGKQLCATI
eukprot:scaffold53009_cov28-Tisochrysis_lutea.AAC.2